jgi:hypothetical protein
MGRWMSRRFSQAPSSRRIDALPAYELPLSTIRNTVRADA